MFLILIENFIKHLKKLLIALKFYIVTPASGVSVLPPTAVVQTDRRGSTATTAW